MSGRTTPAHAVPRASAELIFSALLLCLFAIGGFAAPAGEEVVAGPQFQVSTMGGFEPSVASDADGNFVVVWTDWVPYDPGAAYGPLIFGRLFGADGTPGGPPFQVSRATTGYVYERQPSVSADADGDFVVVWSEDRESFPEGEVIQGRRFAADGTPSGDPFWVSGAATAVPVVLTNPSALAAGQAHTCAIDDNGVSCWGAGEPGAGGVFDHGQSTVPAGLSNPSALAAGAAHTCAIDDNGVSCWGAGESGGSGVFDYGQSTVPTWLSDPSALAAGWFHTCAIDDSGVTCWGFANPSAPSIFYERAPSVALDADGNFVVVWKDSQTYSSGIQGRRFAANGKPGGPAFQVNTIGYASEMEPSVAADADGDFVVVWRSYQYDYPHHTIEARLFAADGTSGGPQFQVDPTKSYYPQPSVAADADGDFVVVWEDYRDYQDPGTAYGYLIEGRRFASDGSPAGDSFQVDDATGYANESQPSVATDADGDFVVVWRDFSDYQDPGAPFGGLIEARRFASDGTPAGGSFQVGNAATGYAREDRPSIAANADGDFVVVWRDIQYYYTGSQIQGRQFTVVGVPIVEVEIDIKPGSDTNPINKAGRGLIPVAILGSETFDVTDVDVTTLAFAPSETEPAHDLTDPGTLADHTRDENGDGFMDLLTHYRTQQVEIGIDGATPCLRGALLDGTAFEGCDTVEVFGTRGGRRSARTH